MGTFLFIRKWSLAAGDESSWNIFLLLVKGKGVFQFVHISNKANKQILNEF